MWPDLFAYDVARQVRDIDTVGWFNETNLGIILPQTSREGCWVLAEKLCGTERFFYRVIQYPPGPAFEFSTPEFSEQKHSLLPDDWPEPRRALPLWKRSIDVFVSFLLILLCAPLWLLIAAGIWVFYGSPILFKQVRVGYRGRPFTLLKFRTMESCSDPTRHESYVTQLIASSEPMCKLEGREEGDPRISRFGRLLRRTCLDELPQLLNVFRGEMSLVGPRPCLPYEAEQYMLWHRRRFDSVPGMTGLWQVNGKNHTTFAEMVRLDLQYERRRSIFFDLKIILRTVPAILSLR